VVSLGSERSHSPLKSAAIIALSLGIVHVLSACCSSVNGAAKNHTGLLGDCPLEHFSGV